MKLFELNSFISIKIYKVYYDKNIFDFNTLKFTNKSWFHFLAKQVPKIFHISYPKFSTYLLNDLVIEIARDDRTIIPTKTISLLPTTHDKETLSIELTDEWSSTLSRIVYNHC